MVFTYNYYFKPRHADFDEYGIAHHSKYFCWFEEARYECFEQFGEAFNNLYTLYKFPLSDAKVKYLRPVADTRELCVKVSIELPIKVAVLKIGYRLVEKTTGILLAKGYTNHVFTNKRLELLTKVPKEFLEIVNMLMENQNEQ